MALRTEFWANYIPVLLGWAVENTDTLFKIHHVVFRGSSGVSSPFLQNVVLIFGATNQFSEICNVLKPWAKNNGFLRILGKNS